METALHSFLVSVSQAAAFWLLMLVLVGLAAALLTKIGRPAVPPEIAAAEADRQRYASEIAVAADRAAASAAGPGPGASPGSGPGDAAGRETYAAADDTNADSDVGLPAATRGPHPCRRAAVGMA